MKKIFFLILPLVLIFSCKNESNKTPNPIITVPEVKAEPIPQKVTISGTIENPVDGSAEIRGDGMVGMKGLKKDLEDGKFNMEFELTEPTNLIFIHGRESASLYLEPGDEVTLTLNPEQFDETIQLAGKGAEESNFLFKKYLLREGMGETKDIFSLDKDAFAAKQDEIKNLIGSNLDTYAKAHPKMNAEFFEAEKKSVLYSWAVNKMNYPGYYEYFTKKDAPELGDNYLSFMNGISMNDEKAYKNDRNYSMLVNSFMSHGTDDMENHLDKLQTIFDKVKSKITNPTIKNEILYSTMNNQIQYGKSDGVEKFVEFFNNETTDEENKTKIADAYKKAIHLSPGVDAPTFAYGDTKDKIVDLKDMKGKNVYIDVWATWCGPCKAEIPSLKELEHQYKGNQNIAFMSVSIDQVKDKEKWLKMIDAKKLGGTQLLADKDWKSSICKDYMIQGIPRFILIDKEGKIIDKNAPRPSSKEIKEILADLSNPVI